MSSAFNLNWGIIATGGISAKFVDDLVLDPKTRQVDDVVHRVSAVASRDKSKAQDFIDKHCGDSKTTTKAYGSYEELVADPDVQAVYIGTPHTSHYANTALALNAKKHVLCEKPFTSNAAELQSLIDLAKKNGVFLMEAIWTRFQPGSLKLKKLAYSGELGEIVSVHADLSGDFQIENMPKTHRILDPMLGGGSLLDLGPYPLIWTMMMLYEHPTNANTFPSHISGSMLMTPLTNVDASCSFSLTFPKVCSGASATLSTSITVSTANPAITVRFKKANILIDAPTFAPKSWIVQYKGKDSKIENEVKEQVDWVGGGWHFQADEVARCVRDGKLESDEWPLAKSLVVMKIFDEVRKQGGYKFPHGVEQVV